MATVSWSCGGGVQSVAIGVLIADGKLPVPDLAAIVNTGYERRTTWRYLCEVLNPYLRAKRGFGVSVVPVTFKRVDLYDKDGKTLMPVFTGTGRLGAFCSGEWKRDAMERWLRTKGVKTCEQWLGFSVDEKRRATGKAHRQWCQPRYPLIELGMSWQDCVNTIEAAGLELPNKSRCYCCPHQDDAEWRDTMADELDGPLAVEMDEEIRDKDDAQDLYLYRGRIPLVQAEFKGVGKREQIQHCQDGGCYT